MQFGVCITLNPIILGKLLETRLLVSSPVLGRSKILVFFTSQRCCVNDDEVLSQFSNGASTNNSWSVTGKGF